MRIPSLLISVFLMSALLLGGCASQQATTESAATATEAKTTASSQATTLADNPQFAKLPRLEGMATVEMVVKGKQITIEVDGTNAPITAGNFVDLVQRGVYNGLVFHRVVKEPQPFVVQGGDPLGKGGNVPVDRLGTGSFIDPSTSRPRFIPLEIKPQDGKDPIYSQTFDKAGVRSAPALRHKRGAVAMARSSPPDSASAQFYFTLADLPFLDGSYAVFGYVTEGMDVVDKIERSDQIESAKVTKGAENLKTGS